LYTSFSELSFSITIANPLVFIFHKAVLANPRIKIWLRCTPIDKGASLLATSVVNVLLLPTPFFERRKAINKVSFVFIFLKFKVPYILNYRLQLVSEVMLISLNLHGVFIRFATEFRLPAFLGYQHCIHSAILSGRIANLSYVPSSIKKIFW
jgi:hypothetical protein